jgi:hypothetical protein
MHWGLPWSCLELAPSTGAVSGGASCPCSAWPIADMQV